MKTLRIFILLLIIISISGAMESCKPRYGSRSLEKRKRKLKRKYKRSGINDCPVFDCRNYSEIETSISS
ncbi:hypothetical protein HZR84_03615 [Hyphobacterium sp. CCMP332]|nr:hypothetical protein HZR84_03615 [Hyphobacterium sp. CCMP332]